MSVIAEALKKAQVKSKKTSKKNFAEASRPKEKKADSTKIKNVPPRKHSYAAPFNLLFVLAVLVLIGSGFALHFLQKNTFNMLSAGKKDIGPNGLAFAKREITKRTDAAQKTKGASPASLDDSTLKPATYAPASPRTTLRDVKDLVKVNGIMYTAKRPLAVINDRIYTEGESVAGFRIREIKSDFVKVSSSDQEFVLRLID